MGVSGCSVIIHADEQPDAHGEIVWSWSPGAETKLAMLSTSITSDGGNKAGPRGEPV
jgi:hypothetical protein